MFLNYLPSNRNTAPYISHYHNSSNYLWLPRIQRIKYVESRKIDTKFLQNSIGIKILPRNRFWPRINFFPRKWEALTTILDQNSSSTPIAIAFSSGVNDSNMDHGSVAYESRNKPGSENRVIFMNERELAYSRERVCHAWMATPSKALVTGSYNTLLFISHSIRHRDMIETTRTSDQYIRETLLESCTDKMQKKVNVEITREKIDYFIFINILTNLCRLNSIWIKCISVKKKLI